MTMSVHKNGQSIEQRHKTTPNLLVEKVMALCNVKEDNQSHHQSLEFIRISYHHPKKDNRKKQLQ